jgi:hypothetical protein
MSDQSIRVLGTEVPFVIASLAHRLHKQRTSDLTISTDANAESTFTPSPGALWSIDEEKITFSSLDIRNRIVATLAFEELVSREADLTASDVFVAVRDLASYEAGHAEKACGHFLALASSRVNVFHAAAQVIQSQEQRPFDVVRALQATLPHLVDISAADLVLLVETLSEKADDNMTVGLLFNDIEHLLITHSATAWSLYQRVKERPSEPIANLYCAALLALGKTEFKDAAIEAALTDIESENPILVRVAVWTIGKLVASNTVSQTRYESCKKALIGKCSHERDDIRKASISALADAAPVLPELSEQLLTLSSSNDQYTLTVVANFLAAHFEVAVSNDQFPALLQALTNLDLDTVHGIESMDEVLSRVADSPSHKDLLYPCLTAWIVKNGSATLSGRDTLEKFNQTIYEIARKPEQLSNLLTRWLLADEPQLGVSSSALVSMLWVSRFKKPTFAKGLVDELDALSLKYLARRMLGFIVHEEPLLSLTFSLLTTKDASSRTFALVHELLCNEIGRDYIRATLDAMEANKETYPDALAMLTSAHSQLNRYVNAIEALPRLQELRPPSHLRRSIQLRRSKEMRKSAEAAEEKSVFRQLSTQIPLKAGVGWFAVKGGTIGETQRLQSFSHSVSLPRRSTADPVGYAIDGLFHRIAKRGDQ